MARWGGARRDHPRQWGCDRRATTPQANFNATRRAEVLFRAAFVARSLQIHFGICASLAPRLREKSLAAIVKPILLQHTRTLQRATPSREGCIHRNSNREERFPGPTPGGQR